MKDPEIVFKASLIGKVCGVWYVACGVWFVACGVERGAWSVERGACSVLVKLYLIGQGARGVGRSVHVCVCVCVWHKGPPDVSCSKRDLFYDRRDLFCVCGAKGVPTLSYAGIHICMYVCMICMYVCMYVCMYTHARTHT